MAPREVTDGEKLGEGASSIMSFKEIWITVGELDFQVFFCLIYKA